MTNKQTLIRNYGLSAVRIALCVATIFLLGQAQAALAQGSKARLVQVLYVIPKGQTAKPDANAAIAVIMNTLQRYYHQQLGVTFGLKTPLVTTINIAEDVNYAVEWENNKKLIQNRLAEDYTNQENVVVSILEGTSGPAGGSYNIVKMTGGFWNTAYKTYKENLPELPKQLAGWGHELGHAFGLLHTGDAKPCFAKNRVDLGTLPNLIMQQTGDAGEIYNFPFHAQEKKLLLDPKYLPECRPFLKGPPDRPHASNHLRYATMASAPRAPAKRYITFSHQAGYVAEMVVLYHVTQAVAPGVTVPLPKTLTTGNKTAGFSARLEIPYDIAPNLPMNVYIKGVGTTKNDFFSASVPTDFVGELCFKAYGIFTNPQGSKC